VIGNGIGSGAANLPEEEPAEPSLAFEYALLLVVYIEQIQLTGAIGEACSKFPQQAPHYGRAKRVEKKDKARTFRKTEFHGIALDHDDWGVRPFLGPPG